MPVERRGKITTMSDTPMGPGGIRDVTEKGAAGRRRKAWVSDNVLDYSPVRGYLPVREESVTQIGAGFAPIRLAVVPTSEITLVRLHIRVLSTGVTVMEPGYSAFLICSRQTSGVRVNGEEASPDRMILPNSGCFHVHGGKRDVFAGAFRVEPFRRTIAALQGVDPEDVDLSPPFLTLRADEGKWLRRLIATTIDQSAGSPIADGGPVMEMIAEAFLRGTPAPTRRALSQATVVRRAEECFAQAEGRRVTLADLCAAAGVGKSALYNAFHALYGQTPLRYFHLRRLGQARSSLVQAPDRRGEVKRAALGAGLTELGRFSVEYRALFGESPSVTLSRRPD